MAEQLQTLKDNFHESFQDVSKTDPEYINLLIGLSSIGVEIPKDEGDDEGEDEGEDKVPEDEAEAEAEDEGELAKSIVSINLQEMKVEETVTDV